MSHTFAHTRHVYRDFQLYIQRLFVFAKGIHIHALEVKGQAMVRDRKMESTKDASMDKMTRVLEKPNCHVDLAVGVPLLMAVVSNLSTRPHYPLNQREIPYQWESDYHCLRISRICKV